jgi:hypothetical protein
VCQTVSGSVRQGCGRVRQCQTVSGKGVGLSGSVRQCQAGCLFFFYTGALYVFLFFFTVLLTLSLNCLPGACFSLIHRITELFLYFYIYSSIFLSSKVGCQSSIEREDSRDCQ